MRRSASNDASTDHARGPSKRSRTTNVLGDTTNGAQVHVKSGTLLQSTLATSGIAYDEVVPSFCCNNPVQARAFLCTALDGQQARAKRFVDELRALLDRGDSDIVFRAALRPLSANCDSSYSGEQSPSFARILLGVDALQQPVAEILIQRLTVLAAELPSRGEMCDRTEALGAAASPECEQMVRTILHQLRWLDYLVDGEALAAQLLEVLPVVPFAVQREMISALPEIVGDTEPSAICAQLSQLLLDTQELMVPILDALTSLNLSPALLSEVTDTVLQTLESAQPDDLPVVVRFLLHTATAEPASINVIVDKLRKSLSFQAEQRGSVAEDHIDRVRGGPPVTPAGTSAQLTLEAIRAGAHFNKHNATTFLEHIGRSGGRDDPHKAVDLWILFAMAGLVQYQSRVHTLFKKKVAARQFSHELLAEAVIGHGTALLAFLPTLLRLAECFVRPVGLGVRTVTPLQSFGAELYRLLFSEFNEMYHRQEVVGNLITHAGSGFVSEVDTALDVLVTLVEPHDDSSSSYAKELAPFSSFVKALLDFVDNLTTAQLRKLFKVLCLISQAEKGAEAEEAPGVDTSDGDGDVVEQVDPELHIIMRKMLTHPTEAMRSVGIIGTVAVVQCLGLRLWQSEKEHTDEQDAADDEAGRAHEQSQQCTELLVRQSPALRAAIHSLQLLKKSCDGHAGCKAMMLDELQRAISSDQFPVAITKWVNDHMSDWLTEVFVSDIEEGDEVQHFCNGSLQASLHFNLDGDDAAIYIPILRLAAAADLCERDKLLFLCPLLRLLAACEMQLHENLGAVDALLGCPLQLFDFEALESPENLTMEQRRVVCDALFYAINWTRELCNSFANCVSDPADRLKVQQRLGHMCELECHLEETLQELGDVVAFPVLQQGVVVKMVSPFGPSKKKDREAKSGKAQDVGAAKGKGKGKGKAKSKTKADEGAQISGSDWQSLVCRDLTPESLDVLSYPKLHSREVDSNQHTVRGTEHEFALSPIHLYKLLKLLRRCTDTKRVELANLLPALREHLDGLAEVAADEDHHDDSERFTACRCVEEAFACIKAMLGRGAKHAQNVLRVFAFGADTPQSIAAFEYFEQYSAACTSIQLAVSWVELLESVVGVATDDDEHDGDPLAVRLSRHAASMLQRDWSCGEASFKYKVAQVSYLVNVHLCHAQPARDALRAVAVEALGEAVGLEKGEYTEDYPTLTTHTFTAYFKPCLERTIQLLPRNGNLKDVHMLVGIFKHLTLYTKSLTASSVVAPAMRFGLDFVVAMQRYFDDKCGNAFGKQFAHHHENVLALLKELQKVTRQLQSMCSHAKRIKSATLSKHGPSLRRELEVLLYRVKQMLAAHSAEHLFKAGTLKSKQLDGSELVAESIQDDSDENNTDDGDAEGDDHDDDA